MKRNSVVITSRIRRLCYVPRISCLCLLLGRSLQVRRRIKCGRFSSPLPPDGGIETGDESDNSIYIPSKPYHASTPRPASSHSTGLERDISDNGKR